MKKVLVVIIAAALCLTFCACGKVLNELKDSAETADETSESAAPEETKVEATPKSEKTGTRTKPAKTGETVNTEEVSKSEEAPKTEETPKTEKNKDTAEAAPFSGTGNNAKTSSKKTTETVTPVISAAKYAFNPVRVTKSPTGEIVYEGGSASFVAYAENSTGISWLIVNPNGRDFVEASALAKSMPGLSISGTASNTLTIGCIPASFDGWYIQAKFYGEGGPVHSSMARLTVWPYPAQGCGIAWDPWSCGGGFNPWSGCPW